MRQSGVRSRVPWGLVVCAVFAATAACTAVAGIGGFAVDPCFNGACRDGGDGGGDEPTDETATPEAAVDAGPCPCPTGTQTINGACVVTTMGSASPASVHCETPLVLPDYCSMRVVLHVCDSDPNFPVAEKTCIFPEAGSATRPTGFVRLGTSDAGTWRFTIAAAYSVSRPNATCTQGGLPCAAPGGSNTEFSTPGVPDGETLAIGKRSDAVPCQDIDVTLDPN